MREQEVEGLRAILHSVEASRACVIMCHGLFGSMYSPKYIELSEELGRRGLSSLRFNQGTGEGGKQATLTQRIEDLKKMVTFARSLGHRRIGLMGSSLGGCVALLFSSLQGGVHALATWATPCRLEGLLEGSELEELARDAERYRPLEAVRRVGAPLLLLHGTEDELVPPHHSRELFEEALPPKLLLWVEGADHRFTHEGRRRVAVEVTAEWLERKLLCP
ncbi:MAG: alpha/beta hydrolase [Candidatus Hadarchaeales archaeon]